MMAAKRPSTKRAVCRMREARRRASETQIGRKHDTASRKLALGFCCDPLEDESGYTWSHTTILRDLLFTAERKYGARDKSWTILGIEICGLHPQIRYPRSSDGARFVSVMLSDAARM